jgi:hypothetical protein
MKMTLLSGHTATIVRCDMEFTFSDDFDAVAWHMERMSKPDYDPYYDESDR